MAVNLPPPSLLPPIAGIRLGCARAIKSKKRDDLLAVEIAPGATAAAVFTRNLYPAAPVQVCRRHLQAGGGKNIRGLVVNAGVANAGTLDFGMRDAENSCRLFAEILKCRPEQILPFSTGVIMERLNMEKYAAGLRRCARAMSPDNWLSAAAAMMTTDTVAKGAHRQVRGDNGRVFNITAVAKGSGMIYPNMATMLAFAATDAAVPAARLRSWQRDIAGRTFNAISVDGDTSTNDSFAVVATGAKGKCNAATLQKIKVALESACAELAEAIVRDGEGASKLIILQAKGAKTAAACRRVAAAVANSPLVKTCLAAGDANVGRFLMAVGNAGGGFDPRALVVSIGNAPIIKGGGLHPRYNEKKAAAALAADEIVVSIRLGDSPHRATLKTCDLTARYIQINADYRS